jgi:DHA1 family bicyclomycin/chloramphenicol resistance-like MFS transporter
MAHDRVSARNGLVAGGGTSVRLVLALLVGASSLGLAATSIYLPSIPDMARDFRVPPSYVQNTLTVYLAAFALSTLVIGSLSDRWGRRRLLIGGTALFALASLVAASAPGIATFMVARVLQAVGACAGMALARAIARDLFDAYETARSLAAISAAITVTPIVAPLVGGYMHVWFGWRSEFVLLSAIALGLTWLLVRYLPETNRELQTQHALVRGLAQGARTLLRERRFVGFVLVIGGSSSSLYAFMTAASLLLIDLKSVPPEQFGRDMMLGPIGYILGAIVTSRFVMRVGPLPLIATGGVCLLTATTALFALPLLSPRPAMLLIPFLVAGLGMGLCVPNGNAGALNIRPQLAGTAAGLAGFLQTTVSACATATVASMVLENAMPIAWLWLVCTALIWLGWVVAR